MAAVGLRELSRETRKVIERVQEDGEPLLIVRHGEPVAALVAVDADNVNRLLLESVPKFVDQRIDADQEVASGGLGKMRSLDQAMAEIDAGEGRDVESDAGESDEEIFGELFSDLSEKLKSPEFAEQLEVPSEVESEPAVVEEIRELNSELLRSFVAGVFTEALNKVRKVNENLADSLREQGNLSSPDFRAALAQVTDTQRLIWLPGSSKHETEPGAEAEAAEVAELE